MTLPNFRLDDKTAFVTGAASGIGRAIALGTAASGARVACFDRPGPALEKVADEVRAAGTGAITVARRRDRRPPRRRLRAPRTNLAR